jgi:hypothetical protein
VTATSSTDEDRAFFQARIALFAKTMFWLMGAVYAVGFVGFRLLPFMRPQRMYVAEWTAVVGVCGLVAIWALARWRRHSMMSLRVLDGVMLVSAGLMIGTATAIAAEHLVHVFFPYTMGVLVVFARVFIIPSSARRTAILSTLCFVPLSMADFAVGIASPAEVGMPLWAFIDGGVVLAGCVVTLAAVGSSVIFGLRREVREARRFGQYTLDRKLGEGGMGVVFKAHHALLRRPTAIKLLPPDKASPQDIARFEREVQLTSELTHPNTIAIFDYGRSTDGVFYYVMEYLDGIDLESLVARFGPLPHARAIRILAQICEALDEAHARGVIHRDVKPANVLLCRRGRVPDFVKVVDFGLVKELARDVNVSAVGTIAGTPAYLAPEALTDPDHVGPPADLYAVGAVGYFLMTGKMVFEGESAMAVCAKHLSTIPPPPSSRTDREIPAAVEKLLLACLEKKPADRPASARALADALGAIPANGWTLSDAADWWTRFESAPRVDAAPRSDTIAVADTIAVLPR